MGGLWNWILLIGSGFGTSNSGSGLEWNQTPGIHWEHVECVCVFMFIGGMSCIGWVVTFLEGKTKQVHYNSNGHFS